MTIPARRLGGKRKERNLWMPIYIADYLLDTRGMSLDEHGAFLLLLMLAWRRDGTLPNDMEWLRTNLPQMHGRTFNAVVPKVLTKFFRLNERGEYVNERLGEELRVAMEFRERRERRAIENADKRWGSETRGSAVENRGSENETGKNPNENNGPECYNTTQHNTVDSIERDSLVTDAPRRPSSFKGSRIPEDWWPSEEREAWAQSLLGTARTNSEIENFRDYWLAKPGAGATKLDWDRTFAVWVRKTHQQIGPHQSAVGVRVNGSVSSAADGKAKWKDALERLGEFAAAPTNGDASEEAIRLMPPEGYA
jgi:uncharacterized protein YdaU (DUF1376 family)